MRWRLSSMLIGMLITGGLLSLWINFGPTVGLGSTFVSLLVLAHVCGARLGSELQANRPMERSCQKRTPGVSEASGASAEELGSQWEPGKQP